MEIKALPTGRYVFKVEIVNRSDDGGLRVFLKLKHKHSSFHDDSLWLSLNYAQQSTFAAACDRFPLDPYVGLGGAYVTLQLENVPVQTIGFGEAREARVVGWSKVAA